MHAYRDVTSTMDVARDLARAGAPEGALVWAVSQSQGRGRQGRTWVSPPGGIYCSLIVRPTRPLGEIPQLALVTGLALAEALKEATGVRVGIRWPNDLLVENLKLCGTLVETCEAAAVIGIGLNVSTDLRELPEGTTSLAAQGISCDPYALAGWLYASFFTWYDLWSSQGFSPIRQRLRPWVGMFGRIVHITTGRHELQGTAADLDEHGRLLVRLDSGLLRAFEMGEVSLLT